MHFSGVGVSGVGVGSVLGVVPVAVSIRVSVGALTVVASFVLVSGKGGFSRVSGTPLIVTLVPGVSGSEGIGAGDGLRLFTGSPLIVVSVLGVLLGEGDIS